MVKGAYELMETQWKQPAIKGHMAAGIVCLSMAALFAGCAVSFVPDVNPSPTVLVDKTVRVASVEGGREPSSFQMYVDNEGLAASLEEALSRGRIFRAVVKDNADIDLHVKIREQDQSMNPISPSRFTMIAEYIFRDAKSGKVIYRDAYQSECEDMSFGSVFHNNRNACRQGGKMNLAAFLEGIVKRWPREEAF